MTIAIELENNIYLNLFNYNHESDTTAKKSPENSQDC